MIKLSNHPRGFLVSTGGFAKLAVTSSGACFVATPGALVLLVLLSVLSGSDEDDDDDEDEEDDVAGLASDVAGGAGGGGGGGADEENDGRVAVDDGKFA